MTNKIYNHFNANGIVLILIVFSNMCFYKLNTQAIYLVMNIVAGVLLILKINLRRIRITRTIKWITLIFAIFILYGIFFLRGGLFNIDRYVIAYYQCVLIYSSLKNIINREGYEKELAWNFGIAAFLCILTMYIQEGSFAGRELRSVGNTMAGNVNTVGMGLGIMSLFLSYYYSRTKKLFVLIFSLVVMGIMMLTGSKKTVVYIIANVFILYSSSKNKITGKIVLISLFSILAYLIFGVDYFYNLLGSRIIDMLGQMGFHIANAHYSYSTEVRMYMIKEAFGMWLKNPILGGGTGYFQSHTATLYEYSHCNVTELLCTFGIFGFIIFYFPHFAYFRRYKLIKRNEGMVATFSLIIIILSLIIDWMAVTYSSFATVYIPILFASVLQEKAERDSSCLIHESYVELCRSKTI